MSFSLTWDVIFIYKSAVPPIFRTNLHSLGFSFCSDGELRSSEPDLLTPSAGSLNLPFFELL